MSAVTLEQVSRRFVGGETAVNDVSLEIGDGEFLVIVGPSGSGKSTVLRLIAGLEMPDAGRIRIDGSDVTHVPPQHRDLAMVFQNYALYPHMSVRENMAFGLRVRRVSTAEVDTRVRATAATLGLEAVLDRRPAQLSGGQRQRVALGRAIVREPRAFLLDEPLSNLDPLLRAGTRTELALLHRRLGTTMVYVTHDQEEAMTLGTRVAVMRRGVIEQVAPALEVFRRPVNAFVAQFVGSPAMNLWACSCRWRDSGRSLLAAGATIDLEGTDWAVPERDDLLVGVRPHDLDLVRPEDGDGVGFVEILEPLGPSTVVHLRVDSMPHALARAVVTADMPIQIGELVGFRARRDRLHLFDRTTGLRVALDAT